MRIAKQNTGRTRKGFTLVELLVAAALSILIMFVIATAFQTGLQTLSTLKSLGDMAERLKTAETLLRTDLESEHFATTGNAAGTAGDDSPGALRVSDLRYDLTTPGRPPLGGFLRLLQNGPSSLEGIDADNLASSRADGGVGQSHSLSVSVKRTGRTSEQLFTAQLAAADSAAVIPAMNVSDVTNSTTTANSRWAQVDWFLDTTRPSVLNGVTTWPLVRRVRPIIEDPNQTVILGSNASAESISMNATNQVNTLRTIAVPANRAPAASIPNTHAKYGDDIVITNVTSFEIKALWTPGAGVPAPRTTIPLNTTLIPNGDFPFDDLPAPVAPATFREFDTGIGAVGNNRIRVIAVQIKIRVYDAKNKLSRQTTMVVKL